MTFRMRGQIPISGVKSQLSIITCVFIEDRNRPVPRRQLGVVDFAQIEYLALQDFPARTSTFDHAPVTMRFTIFISLGTFQVHEGIMPY
jgi:hypothetical protein